MHKIIIASVAVFAVAAIAIGGFLLAPAETVNYQSGVDGEISRLEATLTELGAQTTSDSFSAGQANAAKVQIVTQLDTINNSFAESKTTEPSETEQTEWVARVNRMKNILITHEATLIDIDKAAVATEVELQLATEPGRSSVPTSIIMIEAIQDAEQSIRLRMPNYETNGELDAKIFTVFETAASTFELSVGDYPFEADEVGTAPVTGEDYAGPPAGEAGDPAPLTEAELQAQLDVIETQGADSFPSAGMYDGPIPVDDSQFMAEQQTEAEAEAEAEARAGAEVERTQ